MTANQLAEKPVVPDHVPAELVIPWDYEKPAGADRDVHGANAILLDGPEIFYSPNIRVAARIGGWQIARASLIREMLMDEEHFTVRQQTGFPLAIGESWDLVPLEIEGDLHRRFRQLLNPNFTPGRLKELEGGIRAIAVDLIEGKLDGDGIDFQAELGNPFPIGVFLRMMGLPLEEMPVFLEWVHGVLHPDSPEDLRASAMEIKTYALKVAAERRRAPTDDLFTAIVTAEIDGRPLTDDECLGILFSLFLAGLDTVANSLGFSFRYLADAPEQQALLRAEPGLIPNAAQELLRAFAPSTIIRIVKSDVEFHGIQFKQGDVVRLMVPVAGRDERAPEDRLTLDFRNQASSQLTFGIGPHMCLGQHLARLELQIALQEWLPRMPEFSLDEDNPPVFEPHGVWGVTTLPLKWRRSA